MSAATSKKENPHVRTLTRLVIDEGLPISEAAARTGISVRRAYDFVRRHKLPVNRPIVPHSPREHQLLRALAVFPREVVLHTFSISETALTRELDRIEREERCQAG
jgi:hypothetical protein